MGRIIGEHDQGDVRVTWRDDGDQIGIHYSQDIQPLIDRIAAQNADGGAQVNEGIGVLKYEFPETLLMEHAFERGISFESLAYGPWEETADEWKLMATKWSKLNIEQKWKYM